jgi:UDP-N-acetylmuramoylalanine--D-glutamate ligase
MNPLATPSARLRGTSVLLLGLGDSGLAMARWCLRHGARLQPWDSRGAAAPHAAVLAAEAPGLVVQGGELDVDGALAGVQLVLKSPGLAPHDPRIAPLLARARATGVPVQGELQLFVQALAELKAACGYAPKLVAVTGTNGKTTTVAMATLLIERAGRRVVAAGNIGPTLLQTLADELDALGPGAVPAEAVVTETPAEAVARHLEDEADAGLPATAPVAEAVAAPAAEAAPVAPAALPLPEVWVLELSSFQLDGVDGFAPDAAAVLNLSEDHLDWHGSMEAYAAAKGRIHGPADGVATVRVVNRDDPRVEALALPPAPPAPAKGKAPKPLPLRVVRFGLDAPTRPGDYGLVTEYGMAWLVRAQEADETLRRGRKGEDEEELHIQRLMPADALRVRGRHNAANALAALALAGAIGCPLAPMLHGLRDYAGEPHRVQFVASVGGVDAYDDSKGTNVGATVAAIAGLGEDRAPARLVLILGGDGKGQDFAPLLPPLQRHARAVATLGRDAQAVEAAIGALAQAGLPLQRHDTLEAATRWSFAQARPGDAVLLSPACASLDMFRNYAHRAEVFCSEVRQLAAEAGDIA